MQSQKESIQEEQRIKELQEQTEGIVGEILKESESKKAISPEHQCHKGCSHESHNEEKSNQSSQSSQSRSSHSSQNNQPQLTGKEMASLKKGKYHEAINKFKLSHVILNKKTGVIVEMKAASSIHACNMIGWKPNHCKLLSVIDREAEAKRAQEIKETQETQETQKETKETKETKEIE